MNVKEPIVISLEAHSNKNETNIIDSFSLKYTNRVNNFLNGKITSTTEYSNSLNEPEGRKGSYRMSYKVPVSNSYFQKGKTYFQYYASILLSYKIQFLQYFNITKVNYAGTERVRG